MPLKAKVGGGADFEPVPAGTQIAICNAIVYLGYQQSQFGIKQSVWFRWELPHERLSVKGADMPMTIHNSYTFSMNPKANLRKAVAAWIGGKAMTDEQAEDFDIFDLLGKGCQLIVVHKQVGEKTYANVSGVAGWPKGVPLTKPENPLLRYSVDEHDEAVFQKLPPWIQEKIKSRVPEEEVAARAEMPDHADPSVPF